MTADTMPTGWRPRLHKYPAFSKKDFIIRWMPRNKAWRLEAMYVANNGQMWKKMFGNFPSAEAAAVYAEMTLV